MSNDHRSYRRQTVVHGGKDHALASVATQISKLLSERSSMSIDTLNQTPDVGQLADRYRKVRRFSESLAQPLSAEDCTIQSMPDVSPTKWHLAHTTWFFETFVLADRSGYQRFDDRYAYLFNSYYNTIGKQFPRPQRGLISRPGIEEVLEYRRHVDASMLELLRSEPTDDDQLARIVEIGLQHEQQHQELVLTDIKHVLAGNPLQPVYRPGAFSHNDSTPAPQWRDFDEGVYWIGYKGDDFCFDNESPRHRVFLDAFQLSDSLVSCGDYLRFIDDGGYQRPEFWLSLGWDHVNKHGWQAPLYWQQDGDRWTQFTLSGPREIDPGSPVCHVSYFEADAFARWFGARLPTEAEWEVAASEKPREGNFVDNGWQEKRAIHPAGTPGNILGDVWQWTASPYVAYPGYAPPDGALGEYNGKFMCNQFVLRGGSCATSSTHIRTTYRNFFPPDARWQFSGIRLVDSVR